MTQTRVRSPAGRRALLVSLAAAITLLSGCASIRATSAPGNGSACVRSIARAHQALATDPSSAGGHAAHAAAMHEYHACLAREARAAGERADSTGDAQLR